MKIFYSFIIIIMFIVCNAGLLAFGAEWCVSNSGSDSAPGTQTAPFATIQHAVNIAAAGDTIILRHGVYNETVRIRTPGLTIRSRAGEWARIVSPIDNEEIDTCVYIDLNASGTTLKRLEITGGYYYGVKTESNWDWGETPRYGSSHILLEECRIHDTGRDGVKIVPGSDYVTIRRCEIYNTGRRDSGNAEGVDNVNGDYMTVEDSYIHDTATTGVYAKGGAIGAKIQRCLIMNCGALGVAVGFDTSPEWFDVSVNPGYYENINGLVRNCMIVNTAYAGVGVYAAQNPRIYNNTLINTARDGQSAIHFGVAFHDWEPGIPCPGSQNPILRNNIIRQPAGRTAPLVQIRYTSDHIGLSGVNGGLTMSHNHYCQLSGAALFQDQRPGQEFLGGLAAWKSHIGGDSGSMESNPALNAHYHLQAGSPCIDAGYALPGVSGVPDDYDGGSRTRSWDIGADEYASGLELKIPPPAGTIGTGIVPGGNPSLLVLTPGQLNFGAVPGATSGAAAVSVRNSGTGSCRWRVSANVPWLSISPTSGTNAGTFSVSVLNAGMTPGTYRGQISVISEEASNSPQTVHVTFNVYRSGSPPFGEFAAPTASGVYQSSIPVTGWALDDVEITAVRICLVLGAARQLIGNAVLVEGARPDVAAAYPDYPFNQRAGWGYMLLSYFLPGAGNGQYTLEAIAEDRDGHRFPLGRKTIRIENLHAVKPFGAIDAPGQGAVASGAAYLHGGWVLTPPPNVIPKTGAITLYVDGVSIGKLHYGLKRADIEELFPGYPNRSAAGAYLYLDTTQWDDGLHTMAWSVTDSGGNTDGVGSRYFTVSNGNPQTAGIPQTRRFVSFPVIDSTGQAENRNIPGITISRGLDGAQRHERLFFPDRRESSSVSARINSRERLVVRFGRPVRFLSGALPTGSALDSLNGVFYWLPGPAFKGRFPLEFMLDAQPSVKGFIKGFNRDVRITLNIEIISPTP